MAPSAHSRGRFFFFAGVCLFWRQAVGERSLGKKLVIGLIGAWAAYAGTKTWYRYNRTPDTSTIACQWREVPGTPGGGQLNSV